MKYIFDTDNSRRELMRKIRSKNTKAEVELAKALWHNGIRYRKNFRSLPGKPDIAITKSKVAVFIDGEFWHGYNWEDKKNRISANREYWIPKIEKNIEHDKLTNSVLESMGWKVIRFWENDIKKNLDQCVELVIETIKNR